MNNIKTQNYKNALVEVEAVLECLEDEEYIKIPTNVINAIKTNKNKEYIYEYDENEDYINWNLTPEAKAILYNILKKYLVTEKQKQYFIEKEKLETIKLEREKVQKYNPNIEFKKKKENIDKQTENTKALVEIKQEKWYTKILQFIKKLFKPSKRY